MDLYFAAPIQTTILSVGSFVWTLAGVMGEFDSGEIFSTCLRSEGTGPRWNGAGGTTAQSKDLILKTRWNWPSSILKQSGALAIVWKPCSGQRATFPGVVLLVLSCGVRPSPAQTAVTNIILDLEGGNITLRNVAFTRGWIYLPQVGNTPEVAAYVPQLSFEAVNNTTSSWDSVVVRFDIGGFCNDKARQWSVRSTFSLGWSELPPFSLSHKEDVTPQMSDGNICPSELFAASLVSASHGGLIVTSESSVHDFSAELDAIERKFEADEEAKAEAIGRRQRTEERRRRQAA